MNIKYTLLIAPKLQVQVTFQDIQTEKIIGWDIYKQQEERSILLYPIPIAVQIGDFYELIQPILIWAEDIKNLNFSHLTAMVINMENTKAINLLRNIHTNRTHLNRKNIMEQLLNNNILKQDITEIYEIKKPITYATQLFGCELYCSRQINRFINVKKDKNKDSNAEKTVTESLPNNSSNITKKEWNKFAGRTKGVWQFQTILEKTKQDEKKVLLRINQRLSENNNDFNKVWEMIKIGLGTKS